MKETDIKQIITHSKYLISVVRSITVEDYRDPPKCVSRGTESCLGTQDISSRERRRMSRKTCKSCPQTPSSLVTCAVLMLEINGSEEEGNCIFRI